MTFLQKFFPPFLIKLGTMVDVRKIVNIFELIISKLSENC